MSAIPQTTLIKVRKEGMEAIHPLQAAVSSLTIANEDDYKRADELLSRIQMARRWWSSKISPIIDPLKQALKSAKEALKGAEALEDEYGAPLLEYFNATKEKMKQYKLKERHRLYLAEVAKEAEVARLKKLDEEKAAKLQAATTKGIQSRVMSQRAELQQQIADVEAKVQAPPIKAVGSIARSHKSVKVVDLAAFLNYVVNGEDVLPTELIEINQRALNECYKAAPDAVAKWPGVEVVDDIIIAGRTK